MPTAANGVLGNLTTLEWGDEGGTPGTPASSFTPMYFEPDKVRDLFSAGRQAYEAAGSATPYMQRGTTEMNGRAGLQLSCGLYLVTNMALLSQLGLKASGIVASGSTTFRAGLEDAGSILFPGNLMNSITIGGSGTATVMVDIATDALSETIPDGAPVAAPSLPNADPYTWEDLDPCDLPGEAASTDIEQFSVRYLGPNATVRGNKRQRMPTRIRNSKILAEISITRTFISWAHYLRAQASGGSPAPLNLVLRRGSNSVTMAFPLAAALQAPFQLPKDGFVTETIDYVALASGTAAPASFTVV